MKQLFAVVDPFVKVRNIESIANNGRWNVRRWRHFDGCRTQNSNKSGEIALFQILQKKIVYCGFVYLRNFENDNSVFYEKYYLNSE